MALSRLTRRETRLDYWPGFVDAMASLLLIIIFLLSIFLLAQFFLTQEISGKDNILSRLNAQIAELSDLLSLERAGRRDLEQGLAALTDNLANAETNEAELRRQLSAARGSTERTGILQGALNAERKISATALAQVELLNQQISALRRQLDALGQALDVAEQKQSESQVKIAELGQRLNVALARRVQELENYRSDFFGRLREILGGRDDVSIVGDRFVFQSELIFDSGSEAINPDGSDQLRKLAAALQQLEQDIPEEINWVIRVDGHTDTRPIQSSRFPSNWELSAARAISVVRFLIGQGVSANRLVAAGFGEFQPLAEGNSENDYRRNRRIELKLTEK